MGAPVTYKSINFQQKFSLFSEQWTPKVVAEMNDYQFKVVKLKGDFVWHHHKDTDESFIVIHGALRIDFRNGAVTLRPGEIARGAEHRRGRRRAHGAERRLDLGQSKGACTHARNGLAATVFTRGGVSGTSGGKAWQGGQKQAAALDHAEARRRARELPFGLSSRHRQGAGQARRRRAR